MSEDDDLYHEGVPVLRTDPDPSIQIHMEDPDGTMHLAGRLFWDSDEQLLKFEGNTDEAAHAFFQSVVDFFMAHVEIHTKH